MSVYDLEDKMKQISADITARHKAEAETRGEVYISPEEKAASEQEEMERKAEEKRMEELKAKCAKKGLDFEQEEKKYQDAMAAHRAKAEAKAARKRKKRGNEGGCRMDKQRIKDKFIQSPSIRKNTCFSD